MHQATPHLPPGDYHTSKDAATDGCQVKQHGQQQPDTDSLKTYQSMGNDYYRTWQLQRHLSSDLGPPPYCEQARLAAGGKVPYVEHIYESPKFDRRDETMAHHGRDITAYSGSRTHQSDDVPTEYYELEPESLRMSELHTCGLK